MNYYWQSRVYSAPVPKMPPGLLELMEGLSKDVLRNNPSEVYEFCADHMQKLLQIRDGDKLEKRCSLEQRIKNAQRIVNERAARRRLKYDELIKNHILDNKLQQEHLKLDDKTPEHLMHIPKNVITISDKGITNNQLEILNEPGINEGDEQNVTLSNKCNECGQTDAQLSNDSPNNEGSTIEKVSLERDFKEDGETNAAHSNDGVCDQMQEKTLEVNINDGPASILNDSDSGNVLMIEQSEIETRVHPPSDSDKINGIVEGATETPVDINKNTYENETIKINVIIETEHPRDIESQQNGVTNENGNIKMELIQDGNKLSTDTETDANLNVQGGNSELDNNSLQRKQSLDDETGNLERSDVLKESVDMKEAGDGTSEVDTETIDTGNNSVTNNSITPNTMDLETAAITIQKVFRTFLFKTKSTSVDDATNVDINLFINDTDMKDNLNISNININKERRGIGRMDTVLQTVNEEKSLSLSTDDSSTLSSAATVIQAHIRGFLVRNKLNTNKTSSASQLDSEGLSGTSMEVDSDQQKGKTVLNIHIVPERGHFISRDESVITSTELSMDGSPPSSTGLHPHSYNLNERRKQLKREDAVQSISPPSNNSSSKLSEDIDSVKECLVQDASNGALKLNEIEKLVVGGNDKYSNNADVQTAVEKEISENSPNQSIDTLKNSTVDELDVVTPFEEQNKNDPGSENKLMHSSEFHEMVLPTKVSRSDTSVVREFHNVLAYFLLWN